MATPSTEKRTGFVPTSEPLRAHFLTLWANGTVWRDVLPVAGYFVYTAYDRDGAAVDTYVEPAYLNTTEGCVDTYAEQISGFGVNDHRTRVAILPAGEEPTVDDWGAAEDMLRGRPGAAQ